MTAPAVIAVIAALSQPVPVRLSMTVDPGNGAPVATARLVCGTARNTATGYLRPIGLRRACWKARRRAAILLKAPDIAHRACDQRFGGSETARVTGRIGTHRVRRRFARRDGCEIAEWDALVPLVPPHGIGGLGPPPSG